MKAWARVRWVRRLVMAGALVWGAGVPARAAWGACGGVPGMVRDWGLHREWRVVLDCGHPEAPARLEEIRWQDPGMQQDGAGGGLGARAVSPPEVRAGMRVTVRSEEGWAKVELHGTALTGGNRGATVAVEAGLDGAVVHGIVCGPALVELTRGAR